MQKKFLEKFDKYKTVIELILSLIVAVVGISLTYQANQLSKTQTLIAKQSFKPFFQIEEIRTADDEPIVYISNANTDYYNFTPRMICFVYLTYGAHLEVHRRPTDTFWIRSPVPTDKTNQLQLITSDDYWNKYAELHNGAINYSNLNDVPIRIDLKKYLEISYEDFLGDLHYEYFSVSNVETVKLSPEDGKQIFAEYDYYTEKGEYLDFDSAEVTDIMNMFGSAEDTFQAESYIMCEKTDRFIDSAKQKAPIIICSVLAFFAGILTIKIRELKHQKPNNTKLLKK